MSSRVFVLFFVGVINGKEILHDDFTSIRYRSNWTPYYLEEGNYYYHPRNIILHNGTMSMRAQEFKQNNMNLSSSRICTNKECGFLYGEVEVKAKMPRSHLLATFMYLEDGGCC